ncbi:MAG: STAS domain-containing protein [Chitinivibrionales bacterium]
METDYTLEAEDRREYYLIHIAGKINVSNIANIQRLVGSAAKMGHKQFLLDMGKTTFLDSSAIGMLASFQKQFTSAGGKLCLASLSARISKLLDSCGLLKVTDIYENVNAADYVLRAGIAVEERGFYVLFRLPKDFSLNIVKSLREAIDNSCNKGALQFVFDFEQTRKISSVGIGILMNLHKNLLLKNGGVHLVHLSPEIYSLFESTHVLDVVPYYNSVEAVAEKLIR